MTPKTRKLILRFEDLAALKSDIAGIFTRVTLMAILEALKDLSSDALLLRGALADCGTHDINKDTCGVCGEHFAKCEEEVVYHDDTPGSPAFLECPGARARRVLEGKPVIVLGKEWKPTTEKKKK